MPVGGIDGHDINARLDQQGHAPLVGLELVAAAVLHVDQAADHRGDGGAAPARRALRIVRRDHGGAGQARRQALLRHPLGAVPFDHVADLVAEDARELALVLQLVEEGPRHEHLAAGKGDEAELVLAMNAKLNGLMDREYGPDDGREMPELKGIEWALERLDL